MKRTIAVFLGDAGRRVGTLRFDSQGTRHSAGFEYHASWLAAKDVFALEPNLPLVAGMQYHKAEGDGSVFPGVVADTEPDGWGRRIILRDHAKRRQQGGHGVRKAAADPLNAVDFLLAVDDANRVGALRFQDEEGVFQRAPETGRRTTPPLIEVGALLKASRAVERNTETAADLAYLRGRGTSLGGLRPKCSVLDDDGSLSIGKFPSVHDDRSVTKGEVLALRLAKAAGINAAEARLIDSDGIPVALIRRFDREAGGRLMYISAATMLGVDAASADEHTYTEIIDSIRQNAADEQADIEELWRRIAFNVLINNVDDHLRNHGFLRALRGHWRLAPAFDINPFPERQRELKTWISTEAGPAASIDALLSITPYCRITAARARDILRQVESALARWTEMGRELGMTERDVEQYTEAFEHGERDALRKFARARAARASSPRRAGRRRDP